MASLTGKLVMKSFVTFYGTIDNAIGFPTVAQGKARIREMLSAAHTRDDLDCGLSSFRDVGRELGVIS